MALDERREPKDPDDVWAWVGPRAVVAVLVIVGLVYFGFSVNLAMGCVLVLAVSGWIGYCVRWAFVAENPDNNSRWYMFWERFGRPFHSL